MNCRLRQLQLQGVDINENLPTKSCVIIIARTILKSNRKQVGFLPKQGRFFGQNVEKTLKSRRCTPFFGENRKLRVDKTNHLWYPVVTARLVNSNQGCGGPLQGLRGKQIPPFHSLFFWARAVFYGLLCTPCAARAAFGTAAFADSKKTKTGPIA